MTAAPFVTLFSFLMLAHMVAFIAFGMTGVKKVFKYTFGLVSLGLAPLAALMLKALAHTILRVRGMHPDQLAEIEAIKQQVAQENGWDEQTVGAPIRVQKDKPKVINTASGLKNPFSPEKAFSGDYREMMRTRYRASHREVLHRLVESVRAGRPLEFRGPWAEEAAEIFGALLHSRPQPKSNVVQMNQFRRQDSSEAMVELSVDGESWLNQTPTEDAEHYFAQGE